MYRLPGNEECGASQTIPAELSPHALLTACEQAAPGKRRFLRASGFWKPAFDSRQFTIVETNLLLPGLSALLSDNKATKTYISTSTSAVLWSVFVRIFASELHTSSSNLPTKSPGLLSLFEHHTTICSAESSSAFLSNSYSWRSCCGPSCPHRLINLSADLVTFPASQPTTRKSAAR